MSLSAPEKKFCALAARYGEAKQALWRAYREAFALPAEATNRRISPLVRNLMARKVIQRAIAMQREAAEAAHEAAMGDVDYQGFRAEELALRRLADWLHRMEKVVKTAEFEGTKAPALVKLGETFAKIAGALDPGTKGQKPLTDGEKGEILAELGRELKGLGLIFPESGPKGDA